MSGCGKYELEPDVENMNLSLLIVAQLKLKGLESRVFHKVKSSQVQSTGREEWKKNDEGGKERRDDEGGKEGREEGREEWKKKD